jgi:CBS domain-containing protein
MMLTVLWQEEERKGGKKGRLLGIITLSDVLRYVTGKDGIGEGVEPEEESKSPTESSLKKGVEVLNK